MISIILKEGDVVSEQDECDGGFILSHTPSTRWAEGDTEEKALNNLVIELYDWYEALEKDKDRNPAAMEYFLWFKENFTEEIQEGGEIGSNGKGLK